MKYLLLLLLLCADSFAVEERPCTEGFITGFETLDGWEDDSAEGSPHSYSIENGVLRMTTRPETRDRVKISTSQRFGAGRYIWRVYVPAMGVGDQASIGAFLYHDDKHEVDFEIGYGTAALRGKLNAQETELVCYCTCQAYPYSSSQILIAREAWYNLSMDITHGKDGNYLVTWFVNDRQVKKLQTRFGDEITFTVHCSVENLTFMGDHLPTQENYALFDAVEVKPYDTTEEPSEEEIIPNHE